MNINYGIDLIKILSMFFVVVFHVLGYGRILENAPQFSIYKEIANYLYVLSVCAVNIFVISTGYVYSNKKFKIINLINLWFIVLFYSVIITLVFSIIKYPVDKLCILKAFFPLLTKQYWFFNEYFVLFLFIPFLNFISNNKKILQYIIIISLICFSIITYFLQSDIFSFSNGFGFVWFLILYLIGSYIRKYTHSNKQKNNLYNLLCYFILSIIMMLVLFFIQYIAYKILNKNIVVGEKAISYYSIWVVLEAIFLFMFFKNLKITNNIIIKIISFMSPLIFSVYLISENNLFREKIIVNQFTFILNYNPIIYFLSIIGIALSIFVFCIIVDYVRLHIFNLLKIKNLSSIIEDKLKIIYKKIVTIMDEIL